MKRILLAAVLGVGVLWGCGGDDGGDGIAAETTLAAVTDSQAAALCAGLVSDMNAALPLKDLVGFECLKQTLVSVAEMKTDPTAAACEMAVSSCTTMVIEKNKTTVGFDDAICSNPPNIKLIIDTFATDDCKAYTVGTAKACIMPWLSGLGAGFDAYSCELAANLEAVDAADTAAQEARLANLSDECLTILQKCVGPAFTVSDYIPAKQ